MLFAASATAQVTTSFWMPIFNEPATHIGWVASIVNANETHTTIVADYDNGVDTSALHIGGGPLTMTIGPTVFDMDVQLPAGIDGDFDDDENFLNYSCDWPTPDEADSNRTCTISYPASLVGPIVCFDGTRYASTTEETLTYTHTYPARGSDPAGTETAELTLARPYGSETLSRTNTPSVCSGLSSGGQASEGYSFVDPVAASDMNTYYLVLTAGTEKLDATQAATPTLSNAMSTGTGDAAETGSSGSAAQPEATEGSAPMATGAPMLMGLGAAIALFV
ncbi:hypothetical protein AA0118_g12478 [Alternaria tenuissima]|nr:hypothetical protein AA0118_g12478 [Alternaria tenuissima]